MGVPMGIGLGLLNSHLALYDFARLNEVSIADLGLVEIAEGLAAKFHATPLKGIIGKNI